MGGREDMGNSGLARDAEDSHGFAMNASASAVSDRPHPLQIKAWREMGGAGRSELAAELRRKVRNWKRDALRAQHPEWSGEHLERELAGIYLRGNT